MCSYKAMYLCIDVNSFQYSICLSSIFFPDTKTFLWGSGKKDVYFSYRQLQPHDFLHTTVASHSFFQHLFTSGAWLHKVPTIISNLWKKQTEEKAGSTEHSFFFQNLKLNTFVKIRHCWILSIACSCICMVQLKNVFYLNPTARFHLLRTAATVCALHRTWYESSSRCQSDCYACSASALPSCLRSLDTLITFSSSWPEQMNLKIH